MKIFLRCWAAVLLVALLVAQLPAAAQAAQMESSANPVPKAAKAVVQICTHVPGGIATGTGFGVGKAGEDTDTFITNWHVVTDDDGNVGNVYLMLDNANPQDPTTMVPCEVLYKTDGYPDVAIIRTKKPVKGYKALPLIRSESVDVGSEVFALGYPGIVDDWNAGTNSGVADITVTKGIVSRFMKHILADYYAGKEASNVIVHDALIEHGNSGGPLITAQGAVMGINTYLIMDMDQQSVNDYYCAIYIDYAIEALDKLGIEYEMYTPEAEAAPAEETKPSDTEKKEEDDKNLAQILVIGGILLVAVGAVVVIVLVSKGSGKGGKNAPSITGTAGAFAGRTFVIPAKGLTIGRDGTCDIAFPNGTPGVSRAHCRISRSGDGLVITDLGSSYGTFVAGVKILPNTPVTLLPGAGFYVGAAGNAFQVN